jgi:membrane dipeptidase
LSTSGTFRPLMGSLYDDALVWDDHLGFDADVGTDLNHLDRFRRSGVSFLSINVGYDVKPWQDTFRVLGAYRAFIRTHPDGYALVGSVAEVRAAKDAGRLALAFDLEGMGPLGEDLSLIEVYHALGVRQIGLAYNRNNAFASGCHDEDTGLTPLGREAVAELNRIGVLVDGSHAGERATMQAMELSRAPVVFSHSDPLGVWSHQRNISDDQIRACASSGGVVGINGIGIFLGDNDASTEALVRSIEYVAELVGPAHVGIGLDATFGSGDFEGALAGDPFYWPPGNAYDTEDLQVSVPEQIPEVAQALIDRGWSDDDVRAVLGENFARVASQAWTPVRIEGVEGL